jgi:predicted Zn-dependent protease
VHPEDWSLFARRARAWSQNDQFEKAAADYKRAEQLGNRDQVLDFQTHRVLDCGKTGRWDEALWYLDRLIDARPDDAMLHEERAAIYGKLGRERARETELARALELGTDEGLVIPRAILLAREERWTEAAKLLAQCGRRGPLSRGLAQAWAVAALKAGDHAGFREVCAAVLASQEPDPTVIWNALSAASLFTLAPGGLDDYSAAIHWIERRLSAVPGPPPIIRHYLSNALGGLLLRAGKFDEAIAQVNEGIAAAENVVMPSDWGYLALAHARLGNLDQARKWRNRLRAAPRDPQMTIWDIQELALLQSEVESMLLDTDFPARPFVAPSAK